MSLPAAKAAGINSDGQIAESGTDLFIGSWQIGSMMIGAPLLTVHLTFATQSGSVAGIGQITQPVNPPLEILSKIDGDFTYLTVMPDTSHILVTATGYPVIHWPPHGGIGPVLLPNLYLRMVLAADWQSGTATFRYAGAGGTWHVVESATVEAIKPIETTGKP